jgi:hypothetical protein
MSVIGLLLARRDRGRGDSLAMANFSTRSVRYIFRSLSPKARYAPRRRTSSLEAPRVLALRLAPMLAPRLVVTAVGAVDVATITESA